MTADTAFPPPPPPEPAGKAPKLRWLRWRWLRRLARVFVWFIVLFAVTDLVLSSLWVQRQLVPYVNRQVSKALGTRFSVRAVNIGLPDRVLLYGIALDDQRGQPLLYADALKIGMLQSPLLRWVRGNQKRLVAARSVVLERPYLNLYVSQRDSVFNAAFLFSEDPLDTLETDTLPSRPILLEFDELAVEDLRLDFVDSTLADTLRRPVAGQLNYSFAQVEDFNLSSTFSLNTAGPLRALVQELRFHECHAGFNLQQLQVDFQTYLGEPGPDNPEAKEPYVRFRRLKLDQDSTHLDATVNFENESFDTFFEEGRGQRYSFAFNPSVLHFKTLGFLTGDAAFPLAGAASIEGELTGSADRLRGRDIRLGVGQQTRLLTNIRLTGYQSDSLLMDIDFEHSQLNFKDIDRLLATVELPTALHRLGTSDLHGDFVGFIEDFATDIALTSRHGQVETNLSLKLGGPGQPIRYKGWVRTDSLNVDTLLGVPVSQNLNLYAEVDAAGDALETAAGKLSFYTLPSLINGEGLDTAYGAFTIQNQVIDGSADLIDREGSFHVKLTYDQSGPTPSYFVVGDLQQADLRHYGVTEDSLKLTTIFNVDVRGDSLEVLSGSIRLFEIRLDNYARRTVERIRDVRVSSRLNSATSKQLTIDSELLDFSMQGNFSYTQAGVLGKRLAHEVKLFLENDRDSIAAYYAQKTTPEDSIRVRSQLFIKKLNPTLAFLETGMAIDYGTNLQLSVTLGQEDITELRLEAPHLAVGSIGLDGVAVDLRLDKASLENRFLADGIIGADTIHVGESFTFEAFAFEPRLRNRTLEYGLFLSGDSARKDLTLAGVLVFGRDRIQGVIDPGDSRVTIDDSLWFFTPANSFEVGEGLLQLRNIGIEHNNQRIDFDANVRPAALDSTGAVVREGSDEFLLTLENIELARVADLLNMPGAFSGKLDATVGVADLFGDPIPRINGDVDAFVYQNFRYGDISVFSNWSASLKRLFSRVKLIRDDKPLLTLQGYYNPSDSLNPLDFFLQTDNLPLDLITPFTQGILFDVAGRINIQDIRVRGRLESPVVVGQARFDGVQLGVDYLKTRYRFEGLIRFSDFLGATAVDFPRELTFYDERNNTAKLGGTVYDLFGELFLDLRFSQMDNFLIMNTGPEDNDLFYGRATVARGDARIEGTASRLKLTAKAVTGRGSVVSIPISFYRQDERLPYVFFRRERGQAVSTEVDESSPIAMDLEIQATEDAQLRLVFDEQAGEVIEGNGEGVITLGYDYNADFTMYGTIDILKGNYLLNLQDVIKKSFSVQPGGTIAWSGDPIEAEMNLVAVYRVPGAQLSSLDARQTGQVDVDVFLDLQGSMLQPNISFDLEIPTNNRSQEGDLTLNALLRRIQDDPSELNRQVLSLLLFRRFAPEDGFFTDGGNSGVSGSVTEFISAQLNNWLGKAFDQNLDVKIDAGQFDEINARISARLLNNRLVIERNGALVQSNNQDLTIGNLTIQYRIFPGDSTRKKNPGVLAVQMFRRENLGIGNQISSINQGIGLFYRKDFDTFGELFGKKTKRKAADRLDQPAQGLPNIRNQIQFRVGPQQDSTARDTQRQDSSQHRVPSASLRVPTGAPAQGAVGLPGKATAARLPQEER